MNRTIRDFNVSSSIWPTVDEWAKQTGFRLKKSEDSRRLYMKGGLFAVPVLIEVQQQGEHIHFEAWVKRTQLSISANLLLPPEFALESGGFLMFIPRSSGRTSINKLLGKLDQPAIQ